MSYTKKCEWSKKCELCDEYCKSDDMKIIDCHYICISCLNLIKYRTANKIWTNYNYTHYDYPLVKY